jgi:asparagine synthase (glutamine-hydrolysing)
MCGISGVISKNNIHIDSFVKMNQIIKHRGPDDEGFIFFNENEFQVLGSADTAKDSWSSNEPYSPKSDINKSTVEANIGFGHRRLSILDLSPKGHQPMCSKDERYWITFNGEVYNYVEIREELIRLGYAFNTDTDTEVIITSYLEWGIECQHRFNGMWAFAIYDRQEKTIFLSRDRFGIKPLYYWFSPAGDFYFASEIKQFTVLPGWRASLNKERAMDYLYYAVLDHTEETLFKGVNVILPSHCFFANIEELEYGIISKLPTNKWYNPSKTVFKGSFNEAKEIFLKKFQDAIKLHLRADVPFGSALSGGLDSSSIVSYVNILLKSENKSELQKTFSSCAVDQRYDERVWMDELIKETKVIGHFVYPNGEDVFKLTDNILWHLDEPYQSQAVFLSNHVFKEARKNNVTVLLNGQGADEYMAGYGAIQHFRYKSLLSKGKFSQLFKELKSPFVVLSLLQDSIMDLIPHFLKDWLYTIKKKKHVIHNILSDKIKNHKHRHPYLTNRFKKTDLFNITNYQIFHDPLQKYLKWEDRNSMAYSVEARVPFLDTNLVEFTRSLPVEYLDRHGEIKRILVAAMIDILPEVTRLRKDKTGFITPEEIWFKEDFFDDFVKLFKDNVKYSKGIIKEDEAMRYFVDIKEGKVQFSYSYWHIILFCIWMKVFEVEVD